MIAMLLARLGLVRPAPARAEPARVGHLLVVMDNFC